MQSHAGYLTFAPEDAEAAAEVSAAFASAGLDVPHASALPETRGALQQALTEARCIVALVSPAAVNSDEVRRVVSAALNNAKPIVPVLIADVRPDSWLRVMADRQDQVDARPRLDHRSLDAIVAAVRKQNATGRVIVMLNIKGGVGKTVLGANLFTAAHLFQKLDVAFIDLDPQHNLTQFFLAPAERNQLRADNRTIYSVLVAEGEAAAPRQKFQELVTPLNRSPGRKPDAARLDLLSGDDRLFEFTLDTRSQKEREEAFSRFHAMISSLRQRYAAVVIDTNPCATFLTRCAVTAADHIVAPVRPERYSMTGLTMLEWLTREIRERPVKPSEFSVLLNGVGDRVRSRFVDVDAQTRNDLATAPFFGSTLVKASIPYSGLLRVTPDERFAPNPINATAIMRLAQRNLKEALTSAAAEILARAAA